jgi:hypothetical protein
MALAASRWGMSFARWLPVMSMGLLMGACQDPPSAPIAFVVPIDGAPARFLQAPWPDDLWTNTDGIHRPSGFPNPWEAPTLDNFILLANDEPYAATAPMYFRVDSGIDPATLPASAAASLLADASMFLVQLQGDQRGQRLPIEWRVYDVATEAIPAGTVAVRAVLGFVPRGRFALVVRHTARDLAGLPLRADDDLAALLRCDSNVGVKCQSYQDALQVVGLTAQEVALIQMITPVDAAASLAHVASSTQQQPVTIRDTTVVDDNAANNFRVLGGLVALLQYQQGRPPFDDYLVSGGFDRNNGDGVVERIEWVEFRLTIPRGIMPSSGWPVVVYGHGTGGDLDSGVCGTSGCEAFHLANAGAAMVAVSEPLHRGREGHREGAENLLTFNFLNPPAGRDNWRQSALEKVQLITLMRQLRLRTDDGDVFFNDDKVGYLGHSQGGIVGALLMGIDNRINGAMLSGAGAGFAQSIAYKVDPPPAIVEILRTVLGIDSNEPIDEFHPLLALVQQLADVSDPINYGHRWRHQPGRTPHLLATAGLEDTYTPIETQRGLAVAFELPIVAPQSDDIEGLVLRGLDEVAAPARANLVADNGDAVTAAMAQFPGTGHFAIYDTARGRLLIESYFRSLFDGQAAIGLP